MAGVKSLLVPLLVVIIAVAFQLHAKIKASQKQLLKSDFPAGNFTLAQVPTTFYSVGKIAEVLPAWHHDFHLYRIKEGEEFIVDKDKIKSEVRAKSLADTCKWNSVLCLPCFNSSLAVTSVSTTQIFNEPGWYASFAKISDQAVTELWNLLRLPFNVEVAELEHAFISNLEHNMITAAIHANPMTSSMAIQFIGRKTWLFFNQRTYLGASGFAAVPASPIVLPRRAPHPDVPYELFVYTSQPGDVLFFPESTPHIVFTYAGPNVMINYRNFHLRNIFQQPITWLTATYNMVFHSELVHTAGRVAGSDLQQVSVPEKEMNRERYRQLDQLCEGEDGLTGFDKQMWDVLQAEASKYK